MYEVSLEFEVWSLIFSLFRSSKVELSIGYGWAKSIIRCESHANYTQIADVISLFMRCIIIKVKCETADMKVKRI